MKKNRLIWLVLAGIVLVLLIVGVPILINELYKKNSGYMTIWGAVDVLSYYGMIIAALLGVAGVYLTVYASTKQYREDARNRILPIIAVNVISQAQPDPFLQGFNEDSSEMQTQEDLLAKVNAWLFFSLGKKGVAVLREPKEDDLKMMDESEVIWKRGTIDEKMYVRDTENVCLPLEIENVGNGVAIRLCVALYKKGGVPHYETEILLKREEKRKLYIYSKEQFDSVKGNYIFSVIYSDIAGNRYKQVFPIELATDEKNRRIKSIDLSGAPHLIGRDSSHADA